MASASSPGHHAHCFAAAAPYKIRPSRRFSCLTPHTYDPNILTRLSLTATRGNKTVSLLQGESGLTYARTPTALVISLIICLAEAERGTGILWHPSLVSAPRSSLLARA